MSKIRHTLVIAALASALPLAALAATNLNLDTGATASSGGDITLGSSGIAPVGSATLYSLGTSASAEFSIFTESILAGFASLYSTTPISGSSLAANEFFAVHTNGGNYAKVLLTAASSSSITLQFVTYNTSGSTVQQGSSVTLSAGGGTPGGPTITQVQNNYSWILPGALNYGIAPGSIMTIIGSGLTDAASAVLQSSASPGIPATLNNATVSITVNGTTVHPGIYYAVPTAIAVVVPSSTPIGTGTVIVTHGGTPSSPAPIVVVPAALGLDSLDSSGGGPGTIEDASTYAVFTSTNSARPGENIVLWGSGLGADTADSDTIYTATPHASGTPLQVYIGGQNANILYHGASGYPGLTQIDATIPANTPTGCAIQVVAVTGTGANAAGSNVVTMPIATNGGTCVDSTPLTDSGTLSTLSGKATVNEGILTIDDFTEYSGGTPTTENIAGAIFQSVTGSNIADNASCNYPQIGSCILPKHCTSPLNTTTTSPLYAGTVTVAGPAGSPQTLTPNPCSGQTVFGITIPGCEAQLPSGFIPAFGGTFTFSGTAGTGGTASTDVGAFSASVGFLNPITWTNATSISSVNRASGVTVNWTGGASGTYVFITGDSSSGTTSQSFTCVAPASAGTFTVSPGVLMQLPADSNGGTLSVEDFTDPKNVTIPNVDLAIIIAFTGTTITVPYN